MSKLNILLLIIAAILGASAKNISPDGRIIGGEDAEIADYPYQLSLQVFGLHICGAVMLSPTWAVTAGHCASSNLELGDRIIHAGSTQVYFGGQDINVTKSIVHPLFNRSIPDYDIALLELEVPITTNNTAPVALPDIGENLPVGATTTITGWGEYDENGDLSEHLQVVQVPIVSQEDCIKSYVNETITDRMFCAGLLGTGGKDSGRGDSGGPVIANGVLAGLVSWGEGFADADLPGVNTNIYYFRSWIQEITGL